MRRHITIYTKDKCMPCNFTKKWLDDNGLKYKVINTDLKPESLAEIKRLGYQTLPVVVVKGDPSTSWFGFRPDLMEEELL